MSKILKFMELDIKETKESTRALKTRQESGLRNVPFTEGSQNCYSIFLDNNRRKVIIMLRGTIVESDDLYPRMTEDGELMCSSSDGGLGLI